MKKAVAIFAKIFSCLKNEIKKQAEFKNNILVLHEHHQELTNEYADLEAIKNRKQANYERVKATCIELKDEFNQSENVLNTAENTLKAAEDTVDRLTNKINSLTNKISHIKTEMRNKFDSFKQSVEVE